MGFRGGIGIDDPAGLVALDLANGAPVWCADLAIRPYPDGVLGDVSGGNGLIVVPVDDRLVAFGNGGSGSTCGGAPAPPAAPAAPPPGTSSTTRGSAVEVSSPAGRRVRLTLRAARTRLVVGQRTRLTGVVTGVAHPAGRRVRIEADEHPFGRFRTLTRARVRADGSYAVLLKPARNVRLRAVLERERPVVRTAALTVWADLPVRVRRIGAGGAHPRVRVTLTAPPRASIRTHRPVFYLAAASDPAWRRIVSARWRRRGRTTLTAAVSYPAGRLGATDRVLVCTREPRPDAFGEPVPGDRTCGARRLPRTPG